ncbi:MFS transporter [Haloferula sp.]|uniref:MFS transporter n=1 Tax=Haloferula sp. TaxID=2497595 RepID=UPI003C715693
MAELESTQKRNAARIIAAMSFTKLGDVLINPKTVLTWLLSQMGVSGAIVSMLVPIRESGSMLPQLFISGWVKKARRRKHVFVAGALVQALAVAIMGVSALLLPPASAGLAVLVALGLFATARAFCSISAKDVLGKTIPKGFRGRIGGISATISGVVSTIAALMLILAKDDGDVRTLAWVLLGASTLWLLGAGFYGRVDEPAGEEEGESSSSDVLGRLRLVKDDKLFRRFILVRVLLLGSALGAPVLVVMAGKHGGGIASLIGFVIASGVATAGSSFLWGRLADRAPHRAMSFGGMIAAFVGGVASWIAWSSPGWFHQPLLWPTLFLLFNLGYAGVRLGRKTWVVDAAEGDQRTDYVSASNTIIAVAILVVGGIASPLQSISPVLSLVGFSAFCLLGAIVALGLGNTPPRD